MNDRRPVSYKEFDVAQRGYCLLITGGMMSAPEAVIERYDGTLTRLPIEDIQFLDADAWRNTPREPDPWDKEESQ
jgi:hypothetical protein